MSSMPPPPSEELDAAPLPAAGTSPGESDGQLALIIGIVGIVIGPLSLVALYFAFRGQRHVDEVGALPGPKLRAGRIVAWASLLVFIVTLTVAVITAATG